MKVGSLDFDMDERFGIAIQETGELRLASRKECETWIAETLFVPRRELRGTVAKIKAQFDNTSKATKEA